MYPAYRLGWQPSLTNDTFTYDLLLKRWFNKPGAVVTFSQIFVPRSLAPLSRRQ